MKKFNIKNSKLAIAIGTLSVITLMAIIYAAFTGQLNINGTANVRDSKWDIHIVESGQLEPSNTLSSSAKVLTKPTVSGLSISDFDVSLTTPGDYIEYTFHIINNGDYDAIISDLDKDGVTCTANGSTSDPEAIKVCNKLDYTLKYDNGSDVAEGDTLLSKKTITLILTIRYREFNDPSLLPTTNVSISGLGIDMSYAQKDKAKVNPDGTTPYVQEYSVGDEITAAGEQYYVIADSDYNQDYVTVLKANPLTVDEINTYGAGHVNMYNVPSNASSYHTADDLNGYGRIAYYSSIDCGYSDPDDSQSYTVTGCTTSYQLSDVKYVIDGWEQARFTSEELKTVDGYRTRLITEHEYTLISATESWVYNNSYMYWTMSQFRNYSFMMFNVVGSGKLGNTSVCDYWGSTVRPVINVYKSAIQN